MILKFDRVREVVEVHVIVSRQLTKPTYRPTSHPITATCRPTGTAADAGATV